eukprot:gene3763-3809_t
MSNINWGIIGCGDVTEKKSGPAFNKIQGSRLVAVMRRDASKAGDYAHRHNVPNWYDDANEMMGQEDLNAIYIATPPSSHKDYAIAALAKGFNVYVEKPVTRNAEEAREIAAALRLHPEQKLTVAHYRRAVPMFLKVKQLLESELIGEIRTVQIRMWQSRKPALVASVKDNWRVQPEFSGGGYFHDLAPHQLDLMLTAADDHVCGQILFKNNVVVNGSWCFNVAESETTDSCEIIEEQKIDFVHPEHIQQPMIEKIGKELLDPLIFGFLFAILLLPVANFLEKKFRFPRGLSSITSIILLLAFIGLILYLVGSQISNLASDWPMLKSQVNQSVTDLSEWVQRAFHINASKQMVYVQDTTKKIIASGGDVLGQTFAFWIIGVKYAVLLGIIVGLFNLIPYVGIFTALLLSTIITFATGNIADSIKVAVSVVAIHAVDSNFLLPTIVGSKVKLNALVTFLGIILGEMIWGLSGMFLSIPILAILKIIFDRVDSLKPWGFLFGSGQEKKKSTMKNKPAAVADHT